MNYYNSILDVIGNTPLIRLQKVARDIRATILCKAEFLNPGGSVKDRIGLTMLEDAEKRGLISPGGTVVESTSGNTGVGLALVAATKGYRTVFTMPDKMSHEKIRLLRAFGAEVIVTPTAVSPDSPESYYEVAKRIASERPNSFYVNQYFNRENTNTHYRSTGPEIWEQTDGRITHFVLGMGTGGTISGTGRYLKEKNPSIKVIGVDPEGSILKSYFYTKQYDAARPYKVEGIGEDLIPGTLDFDYIDDIVTVTDNESFHMARRLAREEGLLVGGSSGAACSAALKVADDLPAEAVVVVVFPDSGERYLSKFHSDEWMRENNYIAYEALKARELLSLKDRSIPAMVSVGPRDSVLTALKLMNEHRLSCLPVLENGSSMGSMVEDRIVNRVMNERKLLTTHVEELMEEPLPELDPNAGIPEIARALVDNRKAVLIKDSGSFLGIITIYDLVEFYSKGEG